MIDKVSSPTLTVVLFKWSEPSSFPQVITSPTTKPDNSSPKRSIPSTSNPPSVNFSANSSGEIFVKSTYSLIQLYETNIYSTPSLLN